MKKDRPEIDEFYRDIREITSDRRDDGQLEMLGLIASILLRILAEIMETNNK